MTKAISSALIALLIAISPNSYSASGVESLSPELRALLKQEMLAIQVGMKNIVPAFASGDLNAVSEIAGKINNSFILKQKITESQKHELHEKLPLGFIQKDQQFHKYAGMLEHVSHKKHIELVGFYYSRMLESCIGCHSEYAKHKFPNLSDEPKKVEHHH
ncbi:hypothetical protein [Alkalimarinus alittae]|uniref:Cytochrome c n=1 Tax=Alkalimarinus alittae TaxID=2961619 RepID=A0ABY6MYS2_9ALTE|nr:hypothetical protein [Alkalimarinus alittae]UZE94986.1 hypothetical protein NKI27_13030 [Alkalimarinus alittae]